MSDLDLIAAAACDSHCDLLAYGGPYEPDCGCFRRAAQREIRRLRAERDRLRDEVDRLRIYEGFGQDHGHGRCADEIHRLRDGIRTAADDVDGWDDQTRDVLRALLVDNEENRP